VRLDTGYLPCVKHQQRRGNIRAPRCDSGRFAGKSKPEVVKSSRPWIVSLLWSAAESWERQPGQPWRFPRLL